MMTYNPASRLEEARLRQRAAQQRIEQVATDSIMSWLAGVLRQVVGTVVHAVVDWFASWFRK